MEPIVRKAWQEAVYFACIIIGLLAFIWVIGKIE